MKSETVYLVSYHEDGAFIELLGVVRRVEIGKRLGAEHYQRYHVGAPKWIDDSTGAHAEHERGRYLIGEYQIIEH